MMNLSNLAEDMHVHSTFSDGQNTIAENVAEAERLGLRRMCCVDHVRKDTKWVPEFVAAVAAANATTDVQLFCGLEAKILNEAGELDVPDDAEGYDFLYAADHRVPFGDRCLAPREIRQMRAAGRVTNVELINRLLRATTNVLERHDRVVIAHLFSVLPKILVREDGVPLEWLGALADTAARRGAILEVDERWRSPGLRTVRVFAERGVPIVWSSDAHRASDIGRYEHNLALERALNTRCAA